MQETSLIANNRVFIRNLYFLTLQLHKVQTTAGEGSRADAAQEARGFLKNLLSCVIEYIEEHKNNFDAIEDSINWLNWNLYKIEEWMDIIGVDDSGKPDRNLQEKKDSLKKIMAFYSLQLLEKQNNTLTLLRDFFQIINNRDPKALRKNKEHPVESFRSLLKGISEARAKEIYASNALRLEEARLKIENVLKENEIQNKSLLEELEKTWKNFLNFLARLREDEQLEPLQAEQIKIQLDLFNKEQELGLLEQTIRRVGVIYEKIKDALRNIKNEAFNVSSIIASPVVHPIDTLRNLKYAFFHPGDTLSTAISWVKENPKKAAFISLGIIAGGLTIGFIIGATIGVAGTAIAAGSIAAITTVTIADIAVSTSVAGAVGIGIGALTLTGGIALAGAKASQEMAIYSAKEVKKESDCRQKVINDEEKMNDYLRKKKWKFLKKDHKKNSQSLPVTVKGKEKIPQDEYSEDEQEKENQPLLKEHEKNDNNEMNLSIEQLEEIALNLEEMRETTNHEIRKLDEECSSLKNTGNAALQETIEIISRRNQARSSIYGNASSFFYRSSINSDECVEFEEKAITEEKSINDDINHERFEKGVQASLGKGFK